MLRWQLFNIKNFPSSAQITEPLHGLKELLGPPFFSVKEHYHLSHLLFRLKYSLERQLSLSDNVHRLFAERSLRPLELQCPGCACTAWCAPAPVTGGSTADGWPGSHICQWVTSATPVTPRLSTQIHWFSCGPLHAKAGLRGTRISPSTHFLLY